MSTKIKGLQISIASPEEIKSWSHGEVTKPETINYKTLKPEPGGLFDEVIFGPVNDYECSCGRYKKIKYKGKVCEKCGVEITESIVRRERMGHIELGSPVAHIWMVKELPCPSKISLVLDIPYKEVEEVVYFVNYIVLDNAGSKIFKFKEIVDLSDSKKNNETRVKLRTVIENILETKVEKDSFEYKRGLDFYEALKDSNLPFSITDVFAYIKRYTGIRFGIGSEAIYELLKNTDLQKENLEITEELSSLDPSNVRFKKLLRRLEVIKWFQESNNRPEWMILKTIPVTPPDTRPIVQLDGGRFTTSDINAFYRKIIIRNDRFKRIMELNCPAILLNNEKRMLQEAVDALFDNASRSKPVLSKDKRPLKSLTEHLKGKQGLFRQNLLGKRVDYSGRSVIVVGPELKMYEVGIPSLMILKLFKPFIIHELIRKYDEFGNEIKPIASSIKIAERMILKQEDVIWPIVEEVIKKRPVLLNRAPTLHRLGIQAFEPRMVDGKAIRLHPLVTTAFNADFDGDQMAVHLPISDEAIAEARSLLLASWHILGPKDGKPVITPTQDMILGIYYLTIERKGAKGEGIIFRSFDELYNAYIMKKIDLHAIIGINSKIFPNKRFAQDGILITTPGKLILNNVLPDDMTYLNHLNKIDDLVCNDVYSYHDDIRQIIKDWKTSKPFNKKTIQSIINRLYNNYSIGIVPKIMDAIKALGFEYSTKSSTTVSAFDLPRYNAKYDYFKDADAEVAELKRLFNKGLLTDDERYKKVVEVWTRTKTRVSNDIEEIMKRPENADNSVIIMADSGARGNASQFTQLLGMRGLMSRSYNYDQKSKSRVIRDTIEVPIKHSFIEGLTVNEYFNSSYGARKGMADTAMKTSKSGYMTRKLVDAAQEIIVSTQDCGTVKGLKVRALYDDNATTPTETLAERIMNRYPLNDILDPRDNSLIVSKNEIITPAKAKAIEAAGIEEVEIRSVIHCNCVNGVCQKCFGNDLTTNEPVAIGTTIGVIAAQSIGEPGTQLTMRTFHTGGVSGGSNITQGFERLKQLFDVIPPKEWEKATISQISGTVKSIVDDNEGFRTVTVVNSLDDACEYKVSVNSLLLVKEGDQINAGDKICQGLIDINELLSICGVEKTRHYILEEVQKVYRIQGIEISDKYIEVIIRQMSNKVKVLNPGDSKYFIGEVIDINSFTIENTKLLCDGKAPATAVNLIFGLEQAPSKAGSFLSAASFQDTKKILTDAVVRSQIDYLQGLKENVMLGNLIPAGTGIEDRDQVIYDGEEMYKKEY